MIDRSKEPSGRRIPYASLLLGVLALLFHALPGISSLLEYNRPAMEAGQFWRMITCHFTHFSHEHLLWDLLAFMILGSLCERMDRRGFLLCVTSAALLISLAAWIGLPAMEIYRGLSGIDSALFGLLATMLLVDAVRDGDRRIAYLVVIFGLLFAGKLGYEALMEEALFVTHFNAQVTPVPLAHGVGAAVGIVCAKKRNSTAKPSGAVAPH